VFESIDLTDATLANEVGIGCLTVHQAHLWPLSHYVWESNAKHVGVTFFCDCPSPWDDIGLVRFEVFKVPSSKAEYAERMEWYTHSRKKIALKIADGIKFESSMLHCKALDNWEQDSFALSKREVIRVYKHKKFAVIVRFLARSGTLLDHPVFKRAVKNLAFDENKWVTALPAIVDKRRKKQRFTEYAFDDEQTGEVSYCVKKATLRLKLKKKDDATKWLTAIEKDMDATRGRKNLDEDLRVERAIELGYLVGHVFCESQSWEWCIVSAAQEDDSICICNPNRALAIEPIEWVYRLLVEDVPLNCLLTYNMIDAGRLPPARPDSYTRLN
jgi:hypothetical protein